MFNHIVTLNNVIAIIVLLEERNLRKNAEEKTDGATFFNLTYSYRSLARFIILTVFSFFLFFFKESIMSDDTEID